MQASVVGPATTISRITVASCLSGAGGIDYVPTDRGGAAITRAWFTGVLSSGPAGVRAREDVAGLRRPPAEIALRPEGEPNTS